MSNFDKILTQIEQQKIEPTPKWVLKAKNMWFWTAFVFSGLLGAIAFSIVLFSVQQADFELLQHVNHSGIEMFLSLLPVFWLVTLLLFSILSFVSFKNFKKSYKYSFWSVLAINLFLSLVLGTLFFISGGAPWLEQKFANQIEIYNSIEEQKMQRWMHPENGLLAGTILQSEPGKLTLQDFHQREWSIYYKDIFIAPVVTLEPQEQIKIIGKKLTDNTFQATEIKPWRGSGRNSGKGNRGKNKNFRPN